MLDRAKLRKINLPTKFNNLLRLLGLAHSELVCLDQEHMLSRCSRPCDQDTHSLVKVYVIADDLSHLFLCLT